MGRSSFQIELGLLLQHIQGGGEISVGLVERLHGVHELVGNLAAKLLGQVPSSAAWWTLWSSI